MNETQKEFHLVKTKVPKDIKKKNSRNSLLGNLSPVGGVMWQKLSI